MRSWGHVSCFDSEVFSVLLSGRADGSLAFHRTALICFVYVKFLFSKCCPSVRLASVQYYYYFLAFGLSRVGYELCYADLQGKYKKKKHVPSRFAISMSFLIQTDI